MLQLLFALAAFTVVGIRIYKEMSKDVVAYSFRKQQRLGVAEMELFGYLKQISYFKTLNAEDQKLFAERVHYFLTHKDFQGMDGLTITDEIRAIVSASAVQLSFRLKEWRFPSFHMFRVYPEAFYSNIMRKYLKGGAGHTGQIWFSLKDYRKGFEVPEDGINLGLHEMAHALVIEMKNGNLDHDFTHAHDALEVIAKDRIPKIRNNQVEYLRDYAGTNEMEFVAVATEYFFEAPEALRRNDPELYAALSDLYRQELIPAAATTTNQPTPLFIADAKEEPAKRKRNYRHAKWHWSLTLALLGIFISPVFLIWHITQITLPGQIIAIICLGILLVSGFLLYAPIVKSKALGVTQFLLLHFFGLGPFVLSVVLVLNANIPAWNQGEAYTIQQLYWVNSEEAIVVLKGNAYNRDSDQRHLFVQNKDDVHIGDIVIIVHQYGIFGIPVHGKNLLVQMRHY